MPEDRPTLKRVGTGTPEDDSRTMAARRERGLAILALLARQIPFAGDPEEAIRTALQSAMELDQADGGAFIHLDPETGRIVQAIENGLSREFVTLHVLPELLQRFEQSPLSARHPYFRTCSHTSPEIGRAHV